MIWDGMEAAHVVCLPSFNLTSLDFCISTHFGLFWLPAYSKSMKIKCSHGCIHSVPKTLPEKECYSHFTVLHVNPIPNTFKPLSLNTARKEEAEWRAEAGWHQKPSPGKGKGRGEWDTGAPTPHEHTHERSWAQVVAGSLAGCMWCRLRLNEDFHCCLLFLLAGRHGKHLQVAWPDFDT